MRTKLNIILLAFATVSISLHAGTTPFPAPLPQFMNQEQLTKWHAERAAAVQTASSTQETPTQFYTGKPYVADAGGYIFKYRTYNPEMARWTSADPSGFPDGVNNQVYAPVPTSQNDDTGLRIWYTASPQDVSSTVQADLQPLVLSALAGIPTFANGVITSAIANSGGLYTYGTWSISSFSLSGFASGTGYGTTVRGAVAVPLTGSYILPSGLQPSQMSGSDGTPPTPGSAYNTLAYDSIDGLGSVGHITATFSGFNVSGTGPMDIPFTVTVTSAKMSYVITGSAAVLISLE